MFLLSEKKYQRSLTGFFQSSHSFPLHELLVMLLLSVSIFYPIDTSNGYIHAQVTREQIILWPEPVICLLSRKAAAAAVENTHICYPAHVNT